MCHVDVAFDSVFVLCWQFVEFGVSFVLCCFLKFTFVLFMFGVLYFMFS